MTSLRCKVGDLAIVTKCGVPERIGLLVKVIECCSADDRDWRVEFIGHRVSGRDLKSGRTRMCKFAIARDSSLTPIRPDPLDADIETHEVDHA
ncbi:hypothetical protein QHI69_02685 [Burkholderia gladioli pv. gladioli]|uniref:hypothetical protein n=1 Tax=Burkholderia gladioli TaxID=28095 RepID=UPI0024BC8A7E|nr:hypothetical protein [Burkholderia gladioli]MDJ1160808.1 hypothetical protein [Burkholderia gladioli pv. gladioli]